MTCPACLSHTDTQQEILTCSALNAAQNNIKYVDLLSTDLNVVESALKKYQKLWKKREQILAKK